MKRAILLLMILLSSTTHNTQLWAYSPTNPLFPIPDGSYDNPFGISNIADINEFINDINGSQTDTTYYLLTFDPPVVTVPWGTAAFEGNFDGGGHTVELMLDFPGYGNDNIGLFRFISGGGVKNLVLRGLVFSGGSNIGSLVGHIYGGLSPTIDSIYSAVNVTGRNCVGGICGKSLSPVNITHCINVGRVEGGFIEDWPFRNGGDSVSGIIGYLLKGSVKNNDNAGKVVGGRYTGGVIGCIGDTSTLVHANIVTNTVEGGMYIGGIVGNDDVIDEVFFNFYDNQMNTQGGINGSNYMTMAEGWSTNSMLNDALNVYANTNLFDLSHIYELNLYPRLDTNHPISILAASPVYLSNGERYNYVKSDFSVSVLHNVVWESVNGLVSIDNITGDVTILNIGNETLRAKLNDFVKEVDITIVP